MDIDRRTLLARTLIGAAAAAVVPGGRLLAAAPAPVLSTSFISKLPDYTPASFREWYETHHAPDFLSFAQPYLMRYARNFVVGSRLPNSGIDVISEFGFKSPEAQAEVLRLMGTPAGARIKGPPRAIDKSLAVTMDEQVAHGPPRGYDPPGTRKLGVLLKKQNDLPAALVAAHAKALAGAIAKRMGKDATRIVIDVAAANQAGPPVYDGLVTIWPLGKAAVPDGIAPPPDLEIVNVLDLECHETDLSGSKA